MTSAIALAVGFGCGVDDEAEPVLAARRSPGVTGSSGESNASARAGSGTSEQHHEQSERTGPCLSIDSPSVARHSCSIPLILKFS